MNRLPMRVRIIVLTTVFTLGFLTPVRTHLVRIDNLGATLNGTQIFSGAFVAGPIRSRGAGTVPWSGTHPSDDTSSSHAVMGTVTETGTQGRPDAAPGNLQVGEVMSTVVDDCVSGVSVNCGSGIGPPCRACLLPGGESTRRAPE